MSRDNGSGPFGRSVARGKDVTTESANNLAVTKAGNTERATSMVASGVAKRKPKITNIGITRRSFKMMGPDMRAYFDQACRYHKRRVQELYVNFGYVSGTVSLLVANEATMNAIARWMMNQGAQNEDPKLMEKATKYIEGARKHAMTAWEICAREGKVWKDVAATMGDEPWLMSVPTTAQILYKHEQKAKAAKESQGREMNGGSVDSSDNETIAPVWTPGHIVGTEGDGKG